MQSMVVAVPVDTNGLPSLEAQIEMVEHAKFLIDLKTQFEDYETEVERTNVTASTDSVPLHEGLISDFFDVVKGKAEYTKNYILSNPGPHPVYSSQTTNDGVLGCISTYDFDSKCITWTTDGIHAGTVFLRNGKFSMTTHCGALFLKEEFIGRISYAYAASVLRNTLKKAAVGEQNKRVTVKRIKSIPISFPINGEDFDLSHQISISERQAAIERIKSELIFKIASLRKSCPIFQLTN